MSLTMSQASPADPSNADAYDPYEEHASIHRPEETRELLSSPQSEAPKETHELLSSPQTEAPEETHELLSSPQTEAPEETHELLLSPQTEAPKETHGLLSSTQPEAPKETHELLLNPQSVAQENGDYGAQKMTTWKIHWRAPALMLGYLIFAIVFAIIHHFYWMSLDGTVVPSETNQEWAQRFGIAFAFLAQSALNLSVGVAYTQRVWVTVKRKPMMLSTLDNVFSLQQDIFAFFSGEVLTKAKVLCLIGLCAWCLPISSTISSATLSVRSGVVSNTANFNVPVPDYTKDLESYWATYEGAGRLDGPTPAITRLASATSTSMIILPFSAPFPNASYTFEFYGPAIKCENMSTAVLDTTLNTGHAASLQEAWNLTMDAKLNTTLETLYVAVSPENVVGVAMPSHLFVNTNGSPRFGGRNYSCHLWNTSYTVDFEFTNSVQTTNIRELKYVAPMNIMVGGMFDTYGPGETQYWTMFTALADILVAQVGWGSTGSFIGGDSAIVQTGIAACPEIRYGDSSTSAWFAPLFSDWMCRAGSVPGAIEDLSHNLTLSVLSSALLANETSVDINTRSAANFYTYNWMSLMLAYVIATSATMICVVIGINALDTNGYSAGASFSSILLTTRNADLDELAKGHCLGESPLANDIKTTVLRYGILDSQRRDDSKATHAAFGLRDDVHPIRKGDPCW